MILHFIICTLATAWLSYLVGHIRGLRDGQIFTAWWERHCRTLHDVYALKVSDPVAYMRQIEEVEELERLYGSQP